MTESKANTPYPGRIVEQTISGMLVKANPEILVELRHYHQELDEYYRRLTSTSPLLHAQLLHQNSVSIIPPVYHLAPLRHPQEFSSYKMMLGKIFKTHLTVTPSKSGLVVSINSIGSNVPVLTVHERPFSPAIVSFGRFPMDWSPIPLDKVNQHVENMIQAKPLLLQKVLFGQLPDFLPEIHQFRIHSEEISVSKQHASLMLYASEVWIWDGSATRPSTNGTMVMPHDFSK